MAVIGVRILRDPNGNTTVRILPLFGPTMTRSPKVPRRLTFAQREFGAPMPQQMMRHEVTRGLRVKLFTTLRDAIPVRDFNYSMVVAEPWATILYDLHVEHFELMPDEWDDRWTLVEDALKRVFVDGTAEEIFGLLEFLLRHQGCPKRFAPAINSALESTQAAFRIVDGDTLVPYSSEEETATVVAAISDLADPQLAGAKEHYKKAAGSLSDGDYAGSMRESIHAVESLTKALTGKSTVQNGLKALASQGILHTTVADAFEKVAAWTNAVAGIRHANAPAAPTADVAEEDALPMLTVCGALVSYLKRRRERG